MERWAEIRRNVLTGAMSKREACRHYDIHWLTLQKILAHEEPPGYRRTRPPRRPKIDPVLPVIQAILDADKSARRSSVTRLAASGSGCATSTPSPAGTRSSRTPFGS